MLPPPPLPSLRRTGKDMKEVLHILSLFESQPQQEMEAGIRVAKVQGNSLIPSIRKLNKTIIFSVF